MGDMILYGFIGLGIYFLPTLIADGRRKSNTAAIFVLNLFLGWTGIGWIVAMVWSFMTDSPPAPSAP